MRVSLQYKQLLASTTLLWGEEFCRWWWWSSRRCRRCCCCTTTTPSSSSGWLFSLSLWHQWPFGRDLSLARLWSARGCCVCAVELTTAGSTTAAAAVVALQLDVAVGSRLSLSLRSFSFFFPLLSASVCTEYRERSAVWGGRASIPRFHGRRRRRRRCCRRCGCCCYST